MNKVLILHETVLSVAQTEQFAAAKEEDNLVVPDEFPQDAAHVHLLLGCQLLTRDDCIAGFLHLVFLESYLDKLVAQVDESDTRGVVAAVHDHVDSVSHFLVVVEEMYGKCVVIHNGFVLRLWRKDRDYFETCNILFDQRTLFYTLLLIGRVDFLPLQANLEFQNFKISGLWMPKQYN